MAYSPVPYQLNCGYFPGSEPVKGNWCAQCRALLALYKEDWERVLRSEVFQSLSSKYLDLLLRTVKVVSRAIV